MVGALVLILLIAAGFFSPFLSPYDPTIAGRNPDYVNGAPQIPKFWDENGFSLRPFIYTNERTRSIKTNFRWVTEVDREKRRHVVLFPQGDEYKFLGMTFTTHLFGVDEGKIHLFGTDGTGKDIFSRTLHAINTSMAVGTIGVFIAFVLALMIGGISGYYGGWIDSVLQIATDAVRTIPERITSQRTWRKDAGIECPPLSCSSDARSFRHIRSSPWAAGSVHLAFVCRQHLLNEHALPYAATGRGRIGRRGACAPVRADLNGRRVQARGEACA